MKHFLLLITLLTASCFSASAVKPTIFSSPSTVQRALDVEKSPDFKTFTKKIKKRYPSIKDVAVERWTNGETYYILYCKNNEIGLMNISDTIPMGSYPRSLYTLPHLELVNFKGHTYFKVDDSHYRFANREFQAFNPSKHIKMYGDKEYVVVGTEPDMIFIYTLDGTRLLMSKNVEFRDATPAGFTHDEATGLSIYHPDLPPRFFGVDEYPHMKQFGEEISYWLGFFESPNSKFNIKVPGGEYFIRQDFSDKFLIKPEFREDANGVVHEYKVFQVGEREKGYGNDTKTLCRHGGTTGSPIVGGRLTQIKISTPDQIVYYSVYDDDNFMYRTGCVSLVDSTFKVEPRFADVNVFYDSDRKPYALVRLSSLGQYEIYDPSKSYDYTSMSPLETAFEKRHWNDVIKQIKPFKIEDFQEENLMIWFKAETELLRNAIEIREAWLQRILTNTLFDSERKKLEAVADGTAKLDDNYWHFSISYNLEDALDHFAGKYTSEKADNYTALASYVRSVRKRKEQLEDEITDAQAEYVKHLKDSRIQMELAKQQQIIDEMNARQINEAHQQAVMLQLLGTLSGVISNALSSSSAPSRSSATSTPPVYNAGQSMLDQTYISPEVTGMAISAGWTPDYSNSTSEASPSSSSTSSSSSSRVCHACYGSGKCPHCHGAGHYAPNLNGNHIDCTSCNKSGKCHACNGTGYR